MSETVRLLSREIENLSRRLQKIRVFHVNKSDDREAIRALVKGYFGGWRDGLLTSAGDQGVNEIDGRMQDLLRLAQNRNPVSEYKESLTALRRSVDELELTSLRPVGAPGVRAKIEEHHQRIIDSLRRVNAAAANSYEQGLQDLQSTDRKSWRGTTVEFREALRETLDNLAPDDAVTAQTGYKQEPDTKGPTMKQKAVFILRARHPKDPQVKSFGDAIDVVEELIGKFVRSVYTRSSVAVHVGDTKEEARKVRDYVTLVLGELLEVKE